MRCLTQLAFAALSYSSAIHAQYTSNSSYFQPNSTGFRLQHGFETVLVQPYGYDGFRVRAWPYRPPNGNEISFLYDPPLEGPGKGTAAGMDYDMKVNGTQYVVLRNVNTAVKTYSATADNTTNARLAFYRIESDGSETLLTNEYAPLKSVIPRYYSWNRPGYEFSAAYPFSTTPDEQIYGTGTHQDHLVNKKGNVIDLHFSETGRTIMRPLYMDFSTTDSDIMRMTSMDTNATTQQYMFGPRLLVHASHIAERDQMDGLSAGHRGY
ncbi:hypothetical protein LTR85_000017 [Meristemomyces frigidus]|nr:hypothetical protein LTR85_000017 [Meristemomyces frigidus]